MWRRGMKAGCIYDPAVWFNMNRPGAACPLRKDAVYTVSSVYTDDDDGVLMLSFVGIPGHGFEASGFRPIIERKTDISVFTEILDKVNGKELV